MAGVLLLLTDSQVELLAQKADDIVLKKGAGDVIDGPVFKFAFKQINKAVSPKIPDEYKVPFQEALDEVLQGNFDDAGAEAIDLVKELVADWKDLKPAVKDIVNGLLDIAKGALAGID